MGLTGLELIFFIVASILLGFGFLTEALLIKKVLWLFLSIACTTLKFLWFCFDLVHFFSSNLLPAMSRLRMQKKLGGDTTLAVDPK